MKNKSYTAYPAYALWKREIIRFFRQKSRIVGVLLTPIVFWLILGLGFGESFSTTEAGVEISYLEFFYPGVVVLILLFTSIFSNISLIEDRNEGFFQTVLIAPVSSYGIVAGKVFGGASIALIQACIFFIFAPIAGFPIKFITVLLFLAACIVVSIGLSAFGFIIAWKINSIQGFHGIMNIVLIPMWLLSGAVFPLDAAPESVQWIIKINPIGYSVNVIKGIFLSTIHADGLEIISSFSLIITILFSLAVLLFTARTVRKTRFM